MRRDEEFVGHALVEFFGGPSCASASDGEDPPDLYLAIGASRVGVLAGSSPQRRRALPEHAMTAHSGTSNCGF